MSALPSRFALMILVALPVPAWAHTARPLPQHTITETLDSWITNTENHVVPAGEIMPEAKYAFAPTPQIGTFQGVRTFGEQLKHLAANNYRVAAIILGQRPSA
jgi:hypothetical protein